MYLISALDQSELHLFFYIFWIFTGYTGSKNPVQTRRKTGSSNRGHRDLLDRFIENFDLEAGT